MRQIRRSAKDPLPPTNQGGIHQGQDKAAQHEEHVDSDIPHPQCGMSVRTEWRKSAHIEVEEQPRARQSRGLP